MLQYTKRLEQRLNGNSPRGRARQTVTRNLNVPVANIIKGVKDTNKPYKSTRQLANDLFLQPFYGLGNILLAVFEIIIAPFYFLALVSRLPLQPKGEKRDFFAQSVSLLLVTVSSALFKIVHGAVQIAAWPLTIARSPYRGLLNAIKGRELMENNPTLKNFVSIYQNNLLGDSTREMLGTIIAHKVDKALSQKHRTNINKDELAVAVKESTTDNHAKPLVDFFYKIHHPEMATPSNPTDSPKHSPVAF